MRRDCSHLFLVISLMPLFSALAYGQKPWSGILANSRAIDWSNAGLPATLPDGETAPNAWTPPNRPVCTTLSSSANAAAINSAISACPAGQAVLLQPGTYSLGGNINFKNNVTLRGSGASHTKLTGGDLLLGTFPGSNYASSSWARLTSAVSNFKAGQTQVIVSGGSVPTANTVAWFVQCDSGYREPGGTGNYILWNNGSQTTTCQGSPSDSAANRLFICGHDSSCNFNGGGDPNHEWQDQYVWIDSVTNLGGGQYQVNFHPGLYMGSWNYNQTAIIAWGAQSFYVIGVGVEDMSVGGTAMEGGYASWIKGVRIVGTANRAGSNTTFTMQACAHCLLANSYVHNPVSNTSERYTFQHGAMGYAHGNADTLYLNNVIIGGLIEGGGGNTGQVFAYNYSRDARISYVDSEIEHDPFSSFFLREGNAMASAQDDDTWSTHMLDTFFRNYYMNADPPYSASQMSGFQTLVLGSFARFENIIGNALGGPQSTSYQTTSGGCGNVVFCLNKGGGGVPYPQDDPLTVSSLMRWGNFAMCSGDSHCNTASWDSAEVPTSISGTDGTFDNSVPGSQTLPATFFLSNNRTTFVTAAPNGGTGLSWWKTCIRWTTFPTSCASYTIRPFPPIGPDVGATGLVNSALYPNIAGHAWEIPAFLAWLNLPIDPAYQATATVTGSTWSSSNGGQETLTISSLSSATSSYDFMGGFQLTGAPSACYPGGVAPAQNELFIVSNNNSTTTIVYSLPGSGPASGACNRGTVAWPDVRQFDERVYANDSGGNSAPNPPSGLTAVVQ